MEKEEEIKKNSIETYADDVAKIIENDRSGGLIKQVIHQEEDRKEEKQKLAPELVLLKRNEILMLIGAVFVILSFVTLYLFIFKEKDNTVSVDRQFAPIIFNDQYAYQEVFGLKKGEITQLVLNAANATKVKEGGLEGIYLTENKKIVGLQKFLDLIESKFITKQNNIFVNDNFLMGVIKNQINYDSKSRFAFFILLKVTSVVDVFDSVRSWESEMMTDLSGFIGIDLSSNTNYLFEKNFEDGIIENKNARVLYDKNGGIVMMCVFADDNSIIITNAQSAVHEIILRLASSKAKQ